MKKLTAILAALILFVSSIPAHAEFEFSNAGTRAGQFRKANFAASSGLAIANNGDISGTAGSPTYTGLTVTGNASLGTASTNTLTVNSKLVGASPLKFDGATVDTNLNTFAVADPTAARTTTFPDASGAVMLSSLTTNAPGAANSVTGSSNQLRLEGATADSNYTAITPTDATAVRTITLPDDSGTVEIAATSALTPGSTVTWNPASGTVFTLTPAQAETINMTTTRAVSGTGLCLVVTTSGTSSYTLTFGTNFKSAGTLETGTISGVVYTIRFAYDGTNWNEVARTRGGASNLALTPASTIAVGYGEGLTQYTDTPAQATTFNTAVVGRAGAYFDIVLTTSGTTSYTMTFGTNMKSVGTLETGTITAIPYTIRFVSDGTNWQEVSRVRGAVSNFALVDAATIALGTAEGLTTYTYTPAQTNTINCTVMPRAGSRFSIIYTTSGTNSYTTTFGSNFKTTGTLASGASSAKVFVINFWSDGTNMNEVSRTTAM